MNLVPVSQDCLINPSKVGAIEGVFERDKKIYYVYVDGVKFEYKFEDRCPIENFIEIVKEALPAQQTFGG